VHVKGDNLSGLAGQINISHYDDKSMSLTRGSGQLSLLTSGSERLLLLTYCVCPCTVKV